MWRFKFQNARAVLSRILPDNLILALIKGREVGMIGMIGM